MILAYRLKTIDGDLVQVNEKGESISVQEDGSIQTRPVGTHGPWEVCTRDGAILIYEVEGTTFVFVPDK